MYEVASKEPEVGYWLQAIEFMGNSAPRAAA
jgi:hypothetical protein